MKKISYFIVVCTFMFLTNSSCKKQLSETPPVTTIPDSFSSIVAPSSFNWSTTQKVSFTFTGSSADDSGVILKVTDPDGGVLLQKLQKGNENYNVSLDIASVYETVTVTYGSISENIDCTQGSVSISVN